MCETCGRGGPSGDAARRRLAADPDAHAPHLVDLEVLATIRRWAAAGTVAPARPLEAIGNLGEVPVQRWDHLALAGRIWELRDNVTPYDAGYVALAETLGCAVVTLDRTLARVRGLRCPVEVLSV